MKKKIVFMGTPEFAVPVLQQLIASPYKIVLVVTQPDRPKGRKRTPTPPPIKVEANKRDIPVFQPKKLVSDYEEILSYEPDLIVTAAYGQLLPNELLDWPRYKCINVHASLLPKLRGGAPIHYAVLKGKKETGITIMYMVEKLDAGDILTQQAIPIEDDDDVGSLHDKLSQVGAELLVTTLPELFTHQLTPIKQDEEKASFAPNITRELEEIDWSKNNREIYNQIRGLRPWPVAYTSHHDQLMKIWRAEWDDNQYDGVPGEIVRINEGESFVVVCGDKRGIEISEIQPAGNRKMTVADYLRGSEDRISLGVIMGE